MYALRYLYSQINVSDFLLCLSKSEVCFLQCSQVVGTATLDDFKTVHIVINGSGYFTGVLQLLYVKKKERIGIKVNAIEGDQNAMILRIPFE